MTKLTLLINLFIYTDIFKSASFLKFNRTMLKDCCSYNIIKNISKFMKLEFER